MKTITDISRKDANPAKERPILFSGEMVRAILAGRKTQTRRVMKVQPHDEFCPGEGGHAHRYSPTMVDKRSGEAFPGPEVFGVADEHEGYPCPYGQPGERLWVKEAFLPKASGTIYRADYDPTEADRLGAMYGGWPPSIFCTRVASRVTLELESVRVERLQDISEADAIAEGIVQWDKAKDSGFPNGCWGWMVDGQFSGPMGRSQTPVTAYRALWESINGPGSWDKNPWVWVIEFEKI